VAAAVFDVGLCRSGVRAAVFARRVPAAVFARRVPAPMSGAASHWAVIAPVFRSRVCAPCSRGDVVRTIDSEVIHAMFAPGGNR
jgi:hypothetical protein